MGSYRQHVTVAGSLGLGYAYAGTTVGIHWLYGGVAALLTTVGGLLPDMDSESSVQLRGFTGMIGIIAALLCWSTLRTLQPEVGFELRIWALVIPYLLVRHGSRRILSSITVHRGMWHSVPSCLIAGGVIFQVYPSLDPWVRLYMAIGMMVGFLSHLALDEVCSVDLRGRRVKKSSGTALKLWSNSQTGTLCAYVLLSLLAWQMIERWPTFPVPYAPPGLPSGWPLIELPEDWAWETLQERLQDQRFPTSPSSESQLDPGLSEAGGPSAGDSAWAGLKKAKSPWPPSPEVDP